MPLLFPSMLISHFVARVRGTWRKSAVFSIAAGKFVERTRFILRLRRLIAYNMRYEEPSKPKMTSTRG